MDCFSRDMGPVVRMARPENPNEIDEFINPFCTELNEIGSFQSYCIGHFEQEWLDGLGQKITEGYVPLTELPREVDPAELRHMDSAYIQRMEFSRLDREHFYADAIVPVEITVSSCRNGEPNPWKKKQWYRLRNLFEVHPNGYSVSECSVSIYHKEEANPGLPLSEYLIPVLDEAGLEEEADQMLMLYYPEALMSEPVDGRLLAERMGLEVLCVSLPEEKIKGKSIFRKCSVDIVAPDGKESVCVQPRTIIVNEKHRYDRKELNSIIIHECCHQYEHDLFVWAQSLYNEDIVGIDCPIARGGYPSKGKSPVYWAERQARRMTYRVKMNRMVTKAKTEEYMRLYSTSHPDCTIGEQYESAITELARLFRVTKQSARNRLIELGYAQARGVLNYVDGKHIPPFSFEEKVLNPNQTFLISAKDTVQFYSKDSKFRKLIDSGKYIYIEGRFCLNKKKYVTIGEDGKLQLTRFARLHTELCCLRFDQSGRVDDPKYFLGELHLEDGRPKRQYNEVREFCRPEKIKEPQEDEILDLSTTLKWSVNIRKIIAGQDFGEALKTLMAARDISVERMESESGISVSTLKRLRAGQEATAEQIVAIAVALQLPPTVSGDLLAMCGIRLDYNSTKNTAYQLILASQYTSSIEQVNAFLETCGCKALKTAC